jgi:pimeloyl-ACP methyl ester carboxylesterase
MLIIIEIAVCIIIVVPLFALPGFYRILRPTRDITSVTPKDFGVAFEPVSFRTADDILIKGWFVPCSTPLAKTIILLHGYPADKGDLLSTRLFLHKTYNLLFFDFRYLGESSGYFSTVGGHEQRDLRAALDYLHQRGINEVAAWGLSMGAATALMTIKNAPEIKALIAESPYARLDWMANNRYRIPGLNAVIGQLLRFWGLIFLQTDVATLRPVADAATITIPLLLLFSKDDKLVTFDHAVAMQKAVMSNPHVQMIIYEGKAHGLPIDNYQQIVSDFFQKNFR